MTVQLILLLVSSSLCYNYYDYYDDDYDNSQLQYASHDTQTVVLGSSFAVPCHGQETLLYHNDKRYEEEETFNNEVNELPYPYMAAEKGSDENLVKFMSEVRCRLNPRKLSATENERRWLSDIFLAASNKDTLRLAFGRLWVCAELDIVPVCIFLAFLQHLLHC